MSLENLLKRANEAVRLLITMGWAPADNIAQQNTSELQSIYNALAAHLQSNPGSLTANEKDMVFGLAAKIWVFALSLLFQRGAEHAYQGLARNIFWLSLKPSWHMKSHFDCFRLIHFIEEFTKDLHGRRIIV